MKKEQFEKLIVLGGKKSEKSLTQKYSKKQEKKSVFASRHLLYLNFPYFEIEELQMYASCTTQHPFLLPTYYVNAFHTPTAIVMLENLVPVVNLADSVEFKVL